MDLDFDGYQRFGKIMQSNVLKTRYPVSDKNSAIKELSVVGRDVVVRWSDNHTSRYNAYWLRDNCQSGGDKLSAVRSFTLRAMAKEPSIESVRTNDSGQVVVQWMHEELSSFFDPKWLRAHCCEESSRLAKKQNCKLWNHTLDLQEVRIDYKDLAPNNKTHLNLLECVVNNGFSYVVNLPTTVDSIELFEAYLSPLTFNDFGRIFNLISEPKVWDLSQSSEALDPHTDDPYRYSPPGIRVLYCLEASDEGGGQSEIVNGVSVCEKLRELDPQAFALLSSIAVPFIRYREDVVDQGKDVHLRAEATIIKLDREGQVCGFRFHERSMATLDINPDLMDDFYKALIKLSEMVCGGEFSVKTNLKSGEAFVFDNQLVMHGRSSFEGTSTRRNLQLCQMDRDLVHSRYRLLKSQHGQLGADCVLPPGVC